MRHFCLDLTSLRIYFNFDCHFFFPFNRSGIVRSITDIWSCWWINWYKTKCLLNIFIIFFLLCTHTLTTTMNFRFNQDDCHAVALINITSENESNVKPHGSSKKKNCLWCILTFVHVIERKIIEKGSKEQIKTTSNFSIIIKK